MFRAGPLPPGEYTLHCKAQGFVDAAPARVVLTAEQSLDVGRCALKAGGFVLFQRSKADGRDATLSVVLQTSAGADKTVWFRGDVARSDAIAPGDYMARWTRLGVEKSKAISVVAGETLEVVLD